MIKKLSEYKLIIFDMDGTLYFQRPLRIKMAMSLVKNIFARGGILELRTILTFRKVRDGWTAKGDVDKEQYQAVAEKLGITPEAVQATVNKWIYEAPLGLLKSVRDEELCGMILQEGMPQMVVYSDYPPADKLAALGLNLPSYYSGQENVGIMKPDPKGVSLIMNEYGIGEPSDVLVIGDRQCKDGEMADRAGCDKIILSGSRKKRALQYRDI